MLQDFALNQLQLLEKEQENELSEILELTTKSSPVEIQKKGFGLLGLALESTKSGINGSTLINMGIGIGGLNAFPQNKFRIGDIVLLEVHKSKSKSDSQSTLKLSGVLTRITDKIVTVSIKEELPQDLPNLFQMTKLANTISYKRMKYAMEWLSMQNIDTASPLIKALFVKSGADINSNDTLTNFYEPNLNDSQKEAIKFCLASNQVSLIHGPPGTGKTFTCIQVIRHLADQGKRILACGPSNISVDNLVERLGKCKLDIVRIGHPSRIHDSVLLHALDYRIASSESGQIVNDVRKDLDQSLLNLRKTRQRASRQNIYQDIKHLRSELKQREKSVLKSTIDNAQVVLTTLNGAGTRLLDKQEFDVVLIDEVSQALELECWIAISKGKKLVLAGDHLQLPPTIKSTGDIGKKLSITLFDRLIDLHGYSIARMLNVQYRMHKDIMHFPSKYFYGGKLVCGPTNEHILLADLPNVIESPETTCPLIFIDTSTSGMQESSDQEDSKYNQGEVELVVQHVNTLCQLKVQDSDISIISPYNAQIRLLKDALCQNYPNIEFGTVDGFQGRENQVVIISLVRSNDQGQVGFLKDSRRLNVAITRAKRQLVIIGDSQTLSRNEFLKELIEYCEENGDYQYPANL